MMMRRRRKGGSAPPPPPPPPPPRVLVTSPAKYAARLSQRLADAGMRPLWCPGVATLPFSPRSAEEGALDAAVAPLLLLPTPSISRPCYDCVAFTSRAGVEAVMSSIARQQERRRGGGGQEASTSALAAGAALRRSGALVCALGVDAELLEQSYGVSCGVNPREDASTIGLVRALERHWAAGGDAIVSVSNKQRRVLCPVPRVSHGLAEPSVVPRFLAALEAIGGVEPVRVDAYATVPGHWPPGVVDAGAGEGAARAGEAATEARKALARGEVDAVVFTSTVEAQGLALQFYWGQEEIEEKKEEQQQREAAAAHLRALLRSAAFKRGSQAPVLLAAHGPTTAAGVAEVLGIPLSDILVSKDWSSFAGVTEALAAALLPPPSQEEDDDDERRRTTTKTSA